jgi:uncharacterized protein YjbI with pentapeptide repeats
MTTDAEDRSTWPRNGQVIRRKRLLHLIEENGRPEGLDLRGAALRDDNGVVVGDPIDLSAESVVPLLAAYREANGGRTPPWVKLDGSVELRGAQLDGSDLHGARLQGAGLQGTRLQRAYLNDAQLQGAHLAGAQLQDAHLQCAQLQGAYLFGAELQNANLWRAQLRGTYLEGARLGGADLRYTHLQRLDMYDVATLEGARWYGAHLDHTRVRRDSLGKAIGDELAAHKGGGYDVAKEAYLLLKNNFNQIGRYEDASWAYVKEQQMEKMAYYWEWRSHAWKVWRAWGSFWRWLRNWAYELATGYGERPWNPVIGGLGVVVAFALGFWGSAAIGSRSAWAFLDSFIYSLATFATFNLADTGPTGRGADVASSVEALLGIAVLALVVFTLGNKMSRG